MTVVVTLTARPLNRDGYERVAAAVGWRGGGLVGLSVHVATIEDGATRVTDVWDDEAAADAFLGIVKPALAAEGAAEVMVTVGPAVGLNLPTHRAPRRILVIANRTLGTPQLDRSLRNHLTNERCEFHLLVPVEAVGAIAGGDDFGDPALPGTTVPATSEEVARTRLYTELDRLHRTGIPATGEVGSDDALEAVRDVLRRKQFDEIVLSTLPPGVSRWLGRDLPSRLQRAVDLPVNVVIAETQPS